MNDRRRSLAVTAAAVALGAASALVGCTAPTPTTTPRDATTSGANSLGTSAADNASRHAAAIALGTSMRPAVEKDVHLAPGEHLVVRDAFPNVDGSTAIRYDRTYQGLPVLGEQVIVSHAADGSISVTRLPQVRLEGVRSVQPIVTQSGATERAASRPTTVPVTSRRAQLVVDAATSPAALAWAVTSSTSQGGRELDETLTIVDATSGSVRREQELFVEGGG